MNKTFAVRAVIISIIAVALMTGIFATTFARVVLAEGNSTSHGVISNPQSASASNTAATNTASTADFSTYENSTWGIKIQYPSNWTKQTTGQAVTFVVLHNAKDNNTNPQQFLAKLNVTSIAGVPTNARHTGIVTLAVVVPFAVVAKFI
jgi:hypothetical protein